MHAMLCAVEDHKGQDGIVQDRIEHGDRFPSSLHLFISSSFHIIKLKLVRETHFSLEAGEDSPIEKTKKQQSADIIHSYRNHL
jgi:hypothetical protein